MSTLKTADIDSFRLLAPPDKKFISYQICFSMKSTCRIRIGKLGGFEFPQGDYIYTGSARRNIKARVMRHLKRTKKRHWHIDYLLNRHDTVVQEISLSDLSECRLNGKTRGKIVVRKFGATDCTQGCGSHLKFQGISKAGSELDRVDHI